MEETGRISDGKRLKIADFGSFKGLINRLFCNLQIKKTPQLLVVRESLNYVFF